MNFAKVISFCAAGAIVLAALSGCSSKKHVASSDNRYEKTDQNGSKGKKRYSGEESDAMGRDLVAEARRWLGTPYRYGGKSRSGTDCSGMVMEVYREVCAVKLPRTSSAQMSYCTEVARNKARIGDLMFFGGSGKVSHVGLYIGNGEMIHASSSRGVMVSDVDTGYWGNRLLGAGRVDGAHNSWASIGKGKGKNNKKEKNKPEIPEVPKTTDIPDVQIASGKRPKPVAEIAYNQLPSRPTRKNAQAATTEPATAASTSPQRGHTEAINLLDLIINQKVDSIFTDRFMD